MPQNFLHSKIKKIEKLYPVKCKVISENLAQISKYEAENEQNLDLMSGLFGNIMAEIFAYRHDEWESSLRKIGFFLGKFIYLMDAYDDVEKTSNPAAIIHSRRHTWTILHLQMTAAAF